MNIDQYREQQYKDYQQWINEECESIEETFYCDNCGYEYKESEKYKKAGENLCFLLL